jgi:hypothetical protein
MTLQRRPQGARTPKTPAQQLGPMGAAWESGMISSKQLRKYLASTSEDGDEGGTLHTFDEQGAGGGMRQPKQNLGMGRGHLDDPMNTRQRTPFTSGGKKADRPDWGPADVASRGHIDNARNRATKFLKGASAIPGRERTRVDEPKRASAARAKRTSANEYWPSEWYGTPGHRRQER